MALCHSLALLAAHLEAAEVLQAPQLGGAVCGGRGQHLVDGREADGPDAAAVAPEHAQHAHSPRGLQRPQLGRAILGPGCQQLVVGRHRHAVHVLQEARAGDEDPPKYEPLQVNAIVGKVSQREVTWTWNLLWFRRHIYSGWVTVNWFSLAERPDEKSERFFCKLFRFEERFFPPSYGLK